MYLPDLSYLIIVFGSIIISMTLHEATHAFVSYWLGDDTAKLKGRLTLNPLAHIDPITTVLLPLILAALGAPPFGAAKPVPFNPSRVRFGEIGAALVGIAGPLANLLLAVVAGVIVHIIGLGVPIVSMIVATFALVNISFFVFNLIPFPPLDGSRVIYALAPDFIRSFMERIESMGFLAIIFFMFVFYAVLIEPFIRIVTALANLIIG